MSLSGRMGRAHGSGVQGDLCLHTGGEPQSCGSRHPRLGLYAEILYPGLSPRPVRPPQLEGRRGAQRSVCCPPLPGLPAPSRPGAGRALVDCPQRAECLHWPPVQQPLLPAAAQGQGGEGRGGTGLPPALGPHTPPGSLGLQIRGAPLPSTSGPASQPRASTAVPQVIIHRLLSMFHPRPFVKTRFAPQGAVACLTAISDSYYTVMFR